MYIIWPDFSGVVLKSRMSELYCIQGPTVTVANQIPVIWKQKQNHQKFIHKSSDGLTASTSYIHTTIA